jgi:hypothetical protein
MSLEGSGRANNADLRSLRSKIAASNDDNILRVLEVIDSLSSRGEADSLIAPLRKRMAELRPRRKLSLARLLFTPLNPLIVSVNDWAPDAPAIPRTAIAPMVRKVQRHFGEEQTARINGVVSQHSTDEPLATIVSIGADLWRDAAVILSNADVPDGWQHHSGLRECDYLPLARAVSALLSQAARLLQTAVKASAGIKPDAANLLEIVGAVAQSGSQAAAMLIVLGMHWLPHAELFLRLAEQFSRDQKNPSFAKVTDAAVEFLLSEMSDSPISGAGLAMAANEVKRSAALLEDLLASSTYKPQRKSRVEEARKTIDAACRDRFATELSTNLMGRCSELTTADADTIEQFENTARELRRFESAARRLGGGEHYDSKLRQAMQALWPQEKDDALANISRVRLIEILCGPDAAVAAMEGQRATA